MTHSEDDMPQITLCIRRKNSDALPSYCRIPYSNSGTRIQWIVPMEESSAMDMTLITNYPTKGSMLKFSRPASHQDWTCALLVTHSGVYDYVVSEGEGHATVIDRGCFSILPDLHLDSLDQIRLQTLIPKFMGPLSRWPSIINDSCVAGGYNGIHFAPMQERGHSNSPYSIRDQLALDPALFKGSEPDQRSRDDEWDQFQSTLCQSRRETSMTFLVDVVWNHTSCDSPWLVEHPEAGFNAENAPHLRPAMLIDYAIHEFSAQMTEIYHLSNVIADESCLTKVLDVFIKCHLPKYKLQDYFVFKVKDIMSSLAIERKSDADLSFVEPSMAKALRAATVDEKVRHLVKYFLSSSNPWERGSFPFPRTALLQLAGNAEHLVPLLEALLAALSTLYESKLSKLLNNMYHRVYYERLAEHGPQLGPITVKNPLLSPYFTRKIKPSRMLPPSASPDAIFDQEYFFANNGWIWDADPFIDFASPESDAYFVRDIIIWGDCVKLRYGTQESDSPWLWSHMSAYTLQLAKIFDGFRIDNCHNTPVPVAKRLLQVARTVKPNLYVFAELFTGRAERDQYFVSELGLHSLLRETLVCGSSQELIAQLWKSGGRPVGSLRPMDAIEQGMPHVLLMDCTHDNPMPAEKGCHPAQALFLAALVAFGTCATGSSKGFDELCSHQLDFIHGNSLRYATAAELESGPGHNTGMLRVKKRLNELHGTLFEFQERHIDERFDGELIQVTRAHPTTLESYVLVARAAFHHDAPNAFPHAIPAIQLTGMDVEVVLCARLRSSPPGSSSEPLSKMGDSVEYIRGPSSHVLEYAENNARLDDFVSWTTLNDKTEVTFHTQGWLPGSIMVLKRTPSLSFRQGVEVLHDALASLPSGCVARLSLLDLSVLLYRCHAEESDGGHGGAYVIPETGERVFYCGLLGFYQAFRKSVQENDLGSPLCDHVRKGPWLMDYVTARLEKYVLSFEALSEPLAWLHKVFSAVKCLPNYYHPKYVWQAIQGLVEACWQRAFVLMRLAPCPAGSFLDLRGSLALTSVALTSRLKSALLFPVHRPDLYESLHSFLVLASTQLGHDYAFEFVQATRVGVQGTEAVSLTRLPTLAAGLEHFSTGHMRVWGRDVFISLPGLFLATHRLSEAVTHLVAFASCLRHDGLIPNLLDSGRYPRYNARDAVWWFLRALQMTCQWLDRAANSSCLSAALLSMSVPLRFPDQSAYCHWESPEAYSRSMTLVEMVHHILASHLRGIDFVELCGSGETLDHAMSERGFHVSIHADVGTPEETGFVFGGNAWNCGTWMDKMGDSVRAQTVGLPATPREGAAIELTALLYATVRWAALLPDSQQGLQRAWDSVSVGHRKGDGRGDEQRRLPLNYPDWAELIKSRFESCYFMRREEGCCMYKDTFGAAAGDTQLRPNYVVAVAICPELFERPHAKQALQYAEQRLLAPRGLKTLDPQDSDYRPHYDPSNDSADGSVAHGFNYHNGPEWVWPFGHYLKAQWVLEPSSLGRLLQLLRPHREQLEMSPSAGLVELTQANDAPCHFGSDIQAWSSATILEFIYCMDHL